jgi:hypothetical protein
MTRREIYQKLVEVKAVLDGANYALQYFTGVDVKEDVAKQLDDVSNRLDELISAVIPLEGDEE